MRFLIMLFVPVLVASITNYATCDNDKTLNLLCFDDTDCSTSGFTGAKCTITGGAPSAGAQGCCTGGTADATVTTTTASSAAVGVVITVCLDRLNPRTGVSDCPASASLCKNAVYRNFMTTQCPKTCGYCTSTSSSSSSRSTACFDKLNLRTGVSDCPSRRALCTNTIYRPLMQIQCPLTCGFCTSG
ncbi:hypothetical protein PRIPAC_76126 [Pristionchus pacificus]|uniref:ShK domain-containing protein n=1 Tax=Pristionchus pacificus TaxID=54126 RepID=A0A2A6C0V2_PRIPA|nr:hypothetical protein PRIPAC_76126 [Pristionchus pacificus]|eukprot:PDM71882.1 ShK domain-containing protein [Pristionchus pacificus]